MGFHDRDQQILFVQVVIDTDKLGKIELGISHHPDLDHLETKIHDEDEIRGRSSVSFKVCSYLNEYATEREINDIIRRA